MVTLTRPLANGPCTQRTRWRRQWQGLTGAERRELSSPSLDEEGSVRMGPDTALWPPRMAQVWTMRPERREEGEEATSCGRSPTGRRLQTDACRGTSFWHLRSPFSRRHSRRVLGTTRSAHQFRFPLVHHDCELPALPSHTGDAKWKKRRPEASGAQAACRATGACAGERVCPARASSPGGSGRGGHGGAQR